MRKGKRFSPAWIRKAIADGRGQGTREHYTPWHQIRRADPGSRGRSHLIGWRFRRLHHLLSDLERTVFAFATLLPNILDLREQFPLAREDHVPELASYVTRVPDLAAAGTLELADEMGIKHPVVAREGARESWVFSTDILMTLDAGRGKATLLAISIKQSGEEKKRRTRELLQVEREYWSRQAVEWLLITPDLYDARVSKAMVSALPWALAWPPTLESLRDVCRHDSEALEGMTLDQALHRLRTRFGVDTTTAQRLFWQSVWSGAIPLDLRRFCFGADPIRLLEPAEFWAQNPVVSRRTSWLA